MPKSKLTGVQSSGGRGSRQRPLNLYSPTSMIPKGLMRVMGVPIAEIQLEQFKDAGIQEAYIITQFLENREHLSNRFSDGTHRFGLRLNYSHPAADQTNNGSGDAYLTNMRRYGISGNSIWLPNDNLFEFDASHVIQAHRDIGAVVSIMTVTMRPQDTLRTYGVVFSDAHHKVDSILEKPKNEKQIAAALQIADIGELDAMRLNVNTAGYIIDNDALGKIAKESWVREGRKKISGNFDMAGSLIKGLIDHGHPVYEIPIDTWGDFGSTSCFLDAFPQALSGLFPSIHTILEARGYSRDSSNNVWIHNDSMLEKYSDGKTLEKRIALGRVKIGPNVFIGKNAVIGDGTEIRYSDVEKDVQIGKNAVLDHVYLSPFCQIGLFTNLSHAALGLAVRIDSSEKSLTKINGRSVLGPEIYVPKGAQLDRVIVFPGYQFKGIGRTYSNIELRPSETQLNKLVQQYL